MEQETVAMAWENVWIPLETLSMPPETLSMPPARLLVHGRPRLPLRRRIDATSDVPAVHQPGYDQRAGSFAGMRTHLAVLAVMCLFSTVAAGALQSADGGPVRVDVSPPGGPSAREALHVGAARPVPPVTAVPHVPASPDVPDLAIPEPSDNAERGSEETDGAVDARPQGVADRLRTAIGQSPWPVWLSVATLAVGSLATKLWWIEPGRITWVLKRALMLGFALPLWTKLAGYSLENRNRLAILAFLDKHPGASMRDVQAHAGVAWGTVVYHLDRLARDGKVIGHRSGNHHRYWLSGTPEARVRYGWAALEQPTTRQIARAVAGTPGIHQAAICEVAGVRAPSASKHLARLARLGLVESQRVSRYTVYAPTEELQRILAMYDGDGTGLDRSVGG